MALNAARFTINGTASADASGNKIYRARASEVLTLTLEDNPSAAVSVVYDIFDPANPASPAASTTAVKMALASTGLLFGNGQHSQSPATPNGSATLTMFDGVGVPIAGPMSWIVRCTATLGDGSQQIYARGVSLIAFPDNFREPVFAETDEFFIYGWGNSPLGLSVSNSFPQQSRYGFGTLNSISFATVNISPATRTAGAARTLIAVAQVWGREDGGATQGLWGLRRVAFVDNAGAITLSTNAGGETLDGTILEARFQPSIVLNGTNISVRMDQKVGAHTYDWKCWYTLIEAAE